jgi:hypothetical protein
MLSGQPLELDPTRVAEHSAGVQAHAHTDGNAGGLVTLFERTLRVDCAL